MYVQSLGEKTQVDCVITPSPWRKWGVNSYMFLTCGREWMFPSARSVVVIQRTIKILTEEKPGRIQKERSPDWSHTFHTARPLWFCTSESVQYMGVSSRRSRLVRPKSNNYHKPGTLVPAVPGASFSFSLFSSKCQYHRWSLCVKVRCTLIEEMRNSKDLASRSFRE